MMKDPKAANEAQEQAQGDGQERQDARRQSRRWKTRPSKPSRWPRTMGDKPTPKLDPKDLKDMANKLAGNDEKAKEEAKKQMQDMMKDPKTREQADEDAGGDGQERQESPRKRRPWKTRRSRPTRWPRRTAEARSEDLKDLAKKFKNMDPKAKEELRKQVEEAMKDPKKREEMKKAAEEMAKNANARTAEAVRRLDAQTRRQLALTSSATPTRPTRGTSSRRPS